MDVNVSSDVKGIGMPPPPAVEVENRAKPPVQPVKEGSASERGKLDDQALHNRDAGAKNASLVLNKDEVAKYVKEMQERLETVGTRLRFGFMKDQKTESFVFTVTDQDSGELVRQVPSEKIVELRKKLEDLVGLLFDEKA